VTVGGSGNGNTADLLGVSGTAGNLTKTGTGTWRLTAATTSATARDYDLIVSGGVLELNAASAFVGDDITINAGGTLRLGITNGFASNDDLTLAAGGYLDMQSFDAQVDTFNGNGGYVIGSGVLSVNNNSTFTGTTTIRTGLNLVGATRNWTMTGAADTLLIEGNVSGLLVSLSMDSGRWLSGV